MVLDGHSNPVRCFTYMDTHPFILSSFTSTSTRPLIHSSTIFRFPSTHTSPSHLVTLSSTNLPTPTFTRTSSIHPLTYPLTVSLSHIPHSPTHPRTHSPYPLRSFTLTSPPKPRICPPAPEAFMAYGNVIHGNDVLRVKNQ